MREEPQIVARWYDFLNFIDEDGVEFLIRSKSLSSLQCLDLGRNYIGKGFLPWRRAGA